MPMKLKKLSQFVKEQGGYMAAARALGIYWVNISRWSRGERMPCLPYRDLLASKGLVADGKK